MAMLEAKTRPWKKLRLESTRLELKRKTVAVAVRDWWEAPVFPAVEGAFSDFFTQGLIFLDTF